MPFWVCPCVPPAPALAPNRGPHMAPWRGPCRPPTWGDGLGETYAGGLTPCVTEPRRPPRGRQGGEKGAIHRPTLAGRLGSGWGASCRPLADESAVVTVSPDGSRRACLFGAYAVPTESAIRTLRWAASRTACQGRLGGLGMSRPTGG